MNFYSIEYETNNTASGKSYVVIQAYNKSQAVKKFYQNYGDYPIIKVKMID